MSNSTSLEASGVGPARINVLGVGISCINMSDALHQTECLLEQGGHEYVCVTGVHGVIEAQSDETFRSIQNHSFLTTPDGMPLVWLGKFAGHLDMGRVYGPDYMLEVCRLSVARGYRHFLYGGDLGVAEDLSRKLQARFPGLQVVGTYTPPFRALDENEELELASAISASRPDVLWVGLSTPKQERFMASHVGVLDVKLMVGVGAAFDIHTGRINDAPAWMKRSGLQWLHRLVQEPHRLWRRYLINNPIFIWKVFLQFSRLRQYELG